MNKFNDYDVLLIRQCKKNKPSMRTMRRIIGMRCALPLEYVNVSDVVHFLIEIVRDYNLVRNWDEFLLVDLNPKKNHWYIPVDKRPEEKSYMENLVDVLISKVACTEVKIFPYFRSPLRFRK